MVERFVFPFAPVTVLTVAGTVLVSLLVSTAMVGQARRSDLACDPLPAIRRPSSLGRIPVLGVNAIVGAV